MHQLSLESSWQEEARDADFLDCASLPDYATAGSLAAPVVVGNGVCNPLPFEGAVEQFRALGSSQVAGGWQGDWFIDWQSLGGCLDAPEALPSGSHVCAVYGAGESWGYVKAHGLMADSRSYLS